MPIDHISFLVEYIFLLRDYGDIYKGDPTLYFYLIPGVVFFFANPKSAILHTPFERNILAGFKSLCNILLELI